MKKILTPLLASVLSVAGASVVYAAGCHWSAQQASTEESVVAVIKEPVIEKKLETAVSTYGAGKGHLCERNMAYGESNMSVSVAESSGLETAETTHAEVSTAKIGFSTSVAGSE